MRKFFSYIKSEKIIYFIILFLAFFFGIIIGRFLWNKIVLPFQNPWDVLGTLVVIKYNPLNDIVRFIIFLFCPVLLLYGIYFLDITILNSYLFNSVKGLSDSNNNKLFVFFKSNQKILTFILIIFSIIVSINIPTFHSTGNFDTYHEGESLGTSISYINGAIPYRDFVFVHGLFQDPLRAAFAFNLFGKSIGSVRTLESIVKILTFIVLALFLTKLFHENIFYALICFLIIVSLHQGIAESLNLPKLVLIPTRDIMTFFFLFIFLILYQMINTDQRLINAKKLFAVNFLFSFIPIAAFCYSIDRGFYIFTTYLIIAPIIYSYFHNSNFRFYWIISSFLGISLGFLLMGFFLQGYFIDFFKYSFSIMPRYKELLDGRIYPINNKIGFSVCVLIAGNFYWIAYKFIQELHNNKNIMRSMNSFIKKYLVAFCLLLLSIFLFRSSLGRSDRNHIIYSTSITIILSIYIILNHYVNYYIDRFYIKYLRNIKFEIKKIFPYLCFYLMLIVSITNSYRIYYNNLLSKNFPLNIEDSVFIPNNYKATISFLKDNLDDEEGFITMTSEASWYYLIDRACPIRFPVIWFASPNFYQKEIVEQLKTSHIKYILYKNDHWANSIDGFTNEVRLPIVIRYIKQHYKFFKKIDDNEIWIKDY